MWIESFCAKTIENAETGYYRELAGLLREWCVLDQTIIDELRDAAPKVIHTR
jgi:TorA maturation chaperone TorD